jgi:nicotinamidase-related amidase
LTNEYPIIPAKTGMLFFDTLNIYLRPQEPETRAAIDAQGVIPRMQRMNRACREAGIAIFYAQADYRQDARDYVPHVVERTMKQGRHPQLSFQAPVKEGGWAAEIIPELAPEPCDYVIKKHRWNALFQTPFELSLRAAGIDTIMIAGGSVEIGVASTAYAARDRDFNQIILRDACTGISTRAVEAFMDDVFPFFARVLTVEEAIGLFQR